MIIGIVTLLFGATMVFAQLQSSLKQIWDVKTAVKRVTRRGLLWSLIRTRLLSLTLILVVGFLLLVSLVVSAALAAVQDYLSRALPGGGTLWLTVNFLVSLLVISVLIAMVYRLLPDVRLNCRDVWVGTVTTSVLFGVGKFLIGLYLGHASIGSSYGGGVVGRVPRLRLLLITDHVLRRRGHRGLRRASTATGPPHRACSGGRPGTDRRWRLRASPAEEDARRRAREIRVEGERVAYRHRHGEEHRRTGTPPGAAPQRALTAVRWPGARRCVAARRAR
jgi:hypothetical protein